MLKGNPDLVFSKTGGAGQTPLHVAVLINPIDVTKLLLVHHADVNAKNANGETRIKLIQETGGMVAVIR